MIEEITSKEYRDLEQKKPSKYRNKRVEYDGLKFDSKKEMKRYQELRILDKAGQICCLDYHYPIYELAPGVTYEPDFTYFEGKITEPRILDRMVVEDCKGFRTQAYKIKKKLMKSVYGIDIKEV